MRSDHSPHRSPAGFHANQARWQIGNEFEQLRPWYFWIYQHCFASFIDAMHGKNVLGEVDSYGYDS